MRILVTTFTLLAFTSLLVACNTMEGAGEDLQTGGKKLQRAADDNKGTDSTNY